MSLASSIELTKQRMAQNGGPLPAVEHLDPVTPPAPPMLDIPNGLPNRGSFPASFVLASDFSDNNRIYRQGQMRSSVFPYAQPLGTANTASTPKPATAAATVSAWNPNQNYSPNALVTYGNSLYIALKQNRGSTPSPTSLIWKIVGTASASNIVNDQFATTVNPSSTDAQGSVVVPTPYFYSAPLGSNATFSAHIAISVLTLNITTPVTGGPWRLSLPYNITAKFTGGSDTVAWIETVDANNGLVQFGGHHLGMYDTGRYYGLAWSPISPYTYADNTAIAITLNFESTYGGTIYAIDPSSSYCITELQCEVFASN